MESTTSSSVSSDRKLASLVGSKSARACDNCVKRRARWYCAADDAFLCHSCDSSVHSANPLARRHDRVRLKTSTGDDDESLTPTWHARKARTPRLKKKGGPLRSMNNNPPTADLVPEINWSEENSNEDENDEEQLLYRVPIFDPEKGSTDFDMNHFLPTEMDLAEFAADVESLLGNGLDNESFDMEGLGILDEIKDSRLVKVEEDIQEASNPREDQFVDNIGRESFVLDFDYRDYPLQPEEEEEDDSKVVVVGHPLNSNNNNNNNTTKKKKIFLRLDYEGVMSAWDDHKSPWTTGERPDLDSQECWPDCAGTCGSMHAYGEVGVMNTHSTSSIAAVADGGREARVSRYREKRRTRLFSKKIRYEVRKLNAEKRPRMKGRFVKRTNFVNAPAAGFTTFAQ